MRGTKVGKMQNRITIQSPTFTPDGAGGKIEAWVDALDIWAEAILGGSSRTSDYKQTVINSDVKFRVRAGSGIGKNNRILYNGRVCIIEGIRYVEQDNEFQFIDCRYSENGDSVIGTGTGASSAGGGILTKYLSFTPGSTTITDTVIIGKRVIAVNRNGIQLKEVTTPASGEEVNVNTVTGLFTFGSALGANEYILLIYG